MSNKRKSISIVGKGAKVGVFLCTCGGRVSSKIDLKELEKQIADNSMVSHVEVIPYPCLAPGLDIVKDRIASKGLNRVVIAGCEYRIMLKKIEKELEASSMEKGEMDVVNLRDYVAAVNNGDPATLALKGAKLVNAAVAGLFVLTPSPKTKIGINGPVMILGGGIATYSAAQELIRKNIDTIIAVQTEDIEDEIRMLHERYPGEREYHDRLMKIMEEVDQSPLIKRVSVGELERVLGVVGNYTVTFSSENEKPPLVFNVGAIIAALDGEMLNQGSDFGHDGTRVLCHTEMDEYIWLHGVPPHRIIFWVNDLETDRPYAQLSIRTAWNMARYVRENNALSRVSVLYNNRITLSLSATERGQARNLGIEWISYDGAIRPTVQSGTITYYDPDDHIEHELEYDQLVLSPKRHPGIEQLKVAQILGLHVKEDSFLERNPQMVRPEQVGMDEKFLAGSAYRPCDLREALRQGRRAADKTADIVQLAKKGELYAPRMVCTVDPEKCLGCGLCKEICDCGGISPVEGQGGGIPRVVDPMVCTGGGTCAAACPYQALVLQNNTTEQREARVAVLAQSLADNEVMAIGCNWGGTAAADHAGLRGMPYNERFYLLPVGCIGQLDPTVMGRAFLEGANALLLIGCPPEECHHSYGVDHTWSRVLLIKKLFSLIGLERDRIALAHADFNKPDEYVKTVNSFISRIDQLGPIQRDSEMKAKIQDLYDTLKNPRVRWVLGASLRRPWETTYPADQRNAMAYDETLSDVVMEEFIRTRIVNLLKHKKQVINLDEITHALGEERRKIQSCLTELSKEGMISRIFKDRMPYYTIQ
ncbi:MAG: hydrogenase iron-sulfur subunit [Deltaproteobacteria bacterium]|nr:hydrogenase iron-sulfur subunit [Deltaproteobacteria bacterium]